MIRKSALNIGAYALLAFIAWNGYLAINHLRQTQTIAALTLESVQIQADIAVVLKDLTDMETGQRGYLLTANPAYLQPYTDAKGKIDTDFANLRGRLANRAESEQSLVSQLESLAKSKQAEMERSVSLRHQGYRHRAFVLVNSNEGKDYMDKARALLSSLSETETGGSRFEAERNASVRKALTETVMTNLSL